MFVKMNLVCVLLLALVLLTSCGDDTNPESTQRTTERPTVTTTEMPVQTVFTTSETTQREAERCFDSALAGRYVCIDGDRQGESWYELRADGTGTEFVISEWEFTWESDGNVVLMMDETGKVTRGIIDGDTLTVEDTILETKTVYSRKPQEEVPAESAVPTETASQGIESASSSKNEEYETEELLRDYWERGWYGWWIVEEGFGAYADWGNGSYWWDCCADISWNGDGVLSLLLWDEDGSRWEPMAVANILLKPAEGRYGTAYSIDGRFWEAGLEENEWKLDPESAVYEELLILEGCYRDPEHTGDGFCYTVYLRPWGKLWDDWYAEEPDCLPDYYESWYLPKLAEGALTPPDRIK